MAHTGQVTRAVDCLTTISKIKRAVHVANDTTTQCGNAREMIPLQYKYHVIDFKSLIFCYQKYKVYYFLHILHIINSIMNEI